MTMQQKDLSPLLSSAALERIERMRQHPAAPRFNWVAGDRLIAADLPALDAFRERIAARAAGATWGLDGPPDEILTRVIEWQRTVPIYREQDHPAEWSDRPTVDRDDLARWPARFAPDDQDLERMIVYRTSGTTGHALLVPHHPLAAASYQPLLESALAAYGRPLEPAPDRTACFLLGAQRRTVTYPTALSAWQEAGFAKLNLDPADWRDEADVARYLDEHAPQLLTGDPLTFARLLQLGVRHRPRAVVSTAVAMNPRLKARVAEALGTVVIDWYSLTETGPLAYAAPDGVGYRPLTPDVYLEALDDEGRPVASGEIGEIAVTGGRNPFVPLVRYRTGDHGRIVQHPLGDGRVESRLVDLEGRRPVLFRGSAGSAVHPNDVAAVLRAHPIVQHEVTQAEDGAVAVRVRPFDPALSPDALREPLSALFGPAVRLEVTVDPTLGDDEKVVPYVSAVRLDE
jgi:phenylacetate-CoA ligase